MGKGQNEGGFSEEQIQMYKDCFKLKDLIHAWRKVRDDVDTPQIYTPNYTTRKLKPFSYTQTPPL